MLNRIVSMRIPHLLPRSKATGRYSFTKLSIPQPPSFAVFSNRGRFSGLPVYFHSGRSFNNLENDEMRGFRSAYAFDQSSLRTSVDCSFRHINEKRRLLWDCALRRLILVMAFRTSQHNTFFLSQFMRRIWRNHLVVTDTKEKCRYCNPPVDLVPRSSTSWHALKRKCQVSHSSWWYEALLVTRILFDRDCLFLEAAEKYICNYQLS